MRRSGKQDCRDRMDARSRYLHTRRAVAKKLRAVRPEVGKLGPFRGTFSSAGAYTEPKRMQAAPGARNMVAKIAAVAPGRGNWVETHSAVVYFVLTCAVSWGGGLAVVAPRLVRGESVPKLTGLMLFPVLLLGPLIAGLGMTAYLFGRKGLRGLFARVG